MIIKTNAGNRRELTRQISVLLGQEAVYQRPPTFAYVIGPVTVDRDGNIICEDEEAMNTLGPFLLEQGYIEPDTEALGTEAPETEALQTAAPETEAPETEALQTAAPETEAPETEALGTAAPETNAEDTDSLDITIPITGMDGNQLRNLVYILCGYQYLLNRITRHERFHISEAVIESLTESTPFNSSDFIERMNSFIAGGDLRGAAFSAEHVTLVFPLEKDKPEKTEAYMKLASVIVDAAKTAKRVDTTVRRPENEKYVLRSWLVRLGLGGKDFKAERNALIDGLKGYTAFRTVEEARKHRDKYAEIRKIGRELREGSA